MLNVEVNLMNTSGIISVVSFWIFAVAAAVGRWRKTMLDVAVSLMVLEFISLTACILIRGIESGRFPVSNLFESLLLFAWAITGGYLWLARTYDIRHLGWLVSLAATVFFLYGSWLPADQHTIKPLMPALVSYWRQIHVPPLIVSYALFVIGGIASFMQLWHAGRKRAVYATVGGVVACCAAIALGTFTQIDVRILQAVFVIGGVAGILLAWTSLAKPPSGQRLDLAGTDDAVAQSCICVGVPLLTIGIITGAMWANHAWGTYWSWDPKESMSLVTWLSYSTYIHLRKKPGFLAEKLSLVGISGMLLTLLTYLGFNALGFGGLHSYGGFK